MKELLQKLHDAAMQAILETEDVDSLESLRVKYLGKKGELTAEGGHRLVEPDFGGNVIVADQAPDRHPVLLPEGIRMTVGKGSVQPGQSAHGREPVRIHRRQVQDHPVIDQSGGTRGDPGAAAGEQQGEQEQNRQKGSFHGYLQRQVTQVYAPPPDMMHYYTDKSWIRQFFSCEILWNMISYFLL